MFTYDRAIRLLHSILTLDAKVYSEACCISHSHIDHIRSHRHVFATAATIELMKRRIKNVKATAVVFHQPFDFDGYRITFFPAGHILGSAQILLERLGQRLLYSGDFSLQESMTAEKLELTPDLSPDVLIMECTFGYPRYRFPPRHEVIARLCDWVHHQLYAGKVPIIYAYTLGKSQEVMKILASNGFRLNVHNSILKLADVYESFGCRFDQVQLHRHNAPPDGQVLIMPTAARQTKLVEKIPNKRTMYLSGWAMDPGARHRFGVDEVLPLSDHADFPGLLEYAKRVNARKIFTTHGPPAFARHLRWLGYNAAPLEPSPQLELF